MVDQDRGNRCLFVGLERGHHLAVSLDIEDLDFAVGAANNDVLTCLVESNAVDGGVANIGSEDLRNLTNVPQFNDTI